MEPERPIEKALRKYSQDRRDRAGNDWKLHPANRRMLQDEVRQRLTQGRQQRGSTVAWLLGQWWLRLLAGVGGVAMVAMLVSSYWLAKPGLTQPGNEALLAKNELKTVEPNLAPASDNGQSSRSELDSLNPSLRSKELLADNSSSRSIEPTPLRNDFSAAKDQPQTPTPVAKAEYSIAPKEPAAKPALPTTTLASSPDNSSISGAGITREPGSSLRQELSGRVQAGPAASAAATENVALRNQGQPSPVNAPAQFGATPTLAVAQPAVMQATKPTEAAVDSAINQVVQYGYFVGNQIMGRENRSFQQVSRQRSLDYGKKLKEGTVPSPEPILGYFRVEQSGSELRVIDSDGSVYSGQFEPAAPAMVAVSAGSQRAKSAQARVNHKAESIDSVPNVPQQVPAQLGLAFRVLGTNQRSNQKVIFAGTMTGLTNFLDGRQQNQNQGATGFVTQITNQANSTPQQQVNQATGNWRLSGRALIGDGQELDVEAFPAPVQQAPR